MTKHEYRAKYRGFVVMLDREQATYWWQGGAGYQSLTKACKAIDEFKGEDRAPVRNYTGGDQGVHWNCGTKRTEWGAC